MPSFPVKIMRRHDVAVLAAFLLSSLALAALPGGFKRSMGNAVVRVFYAPLQLPLYQLRSLLIAWEENLELRRLLAEARLKNLSLNEARRENDRLRALLGQRGRREWALVPAQVTGREPALLAPELRIDRGGDGGLDTGMVAFTVDGLVGKITDIRPDGATVRTVFDPQSRVSAIVLRSRVLGVFRTVRGTKCILDRVPVRSDVRQGDTIVTSGYGWLFPFGLPLGVVEEVVSHSRSLTLQIAVRPALDADRIDHLFVIAGGATPQLPALVPAGDAVADSLRARRRRRAAGTAVLKLAVPRLLIELPDTLGLQPGGVR